MAGASQYAWLSLSIDGLTDDLHPYLNSVSYKESKDALDMLDASISVPETGGSHPIQKKLMLPGAPFKLCFHRGSTVVREVTGDIVAVRHQKTVDGRWSLQLTGLEVLHRLKGADLTAISEDGLQGLLDEVARDYRAKAREEGRALSESQPIMLDADVLGMLKVYADMRGSYLSTDSSGKIVIRDRGQNSGVAEVRWGDDVESISLGLDLAGLPTKVTVLGLDAESGKPDKDPQHTHAQAADRQGARQTGVALRKKLWGEQESKVYPWSIEDPVFPGSAPSDAKSKAESAMQNAADAYLRGSVTVRGCPEASKDAGLKILDAPWPLCGEFVIADVSHSYTADEGLRTEIEFYSDGVAQASSAGNTGAA